ncbi:NUDIX domain-containing protein [Kitasatospora sp. NPDC057198]|uniref:NUDIX hydrolase n=1 Tax=Kitasatospora sp. NPDC057198 TaxID=3346046 RepID=UPI003645950F
MPTPQFILDLRAHIGHAPLWLSGITAVVVEDGRILLNRRSDTGRWALLHGIVEPGEQPADTVVREVLEETGVTVLPERITSVHTLPAFACANGDQVQYLDVAFRCRPLSGEAVVNDEESLAVAWFPLDDLPPLAPNDTLLLEKALADHPAPWFAVG